MVKQTNLQNTKHIGFTTLESIQWKLRCSCDQFVAIYIVACFLFLLHAMVGGLLVGRLMFSSGKGSGCGARCGLRTWKWSWLSWLSLLSLQSSSGFPYAMVLFATNPPVHQILHPQLHLHLLAACLPMILIKHCMQIHTHIYSCTVLPNLWFQSHFTCFICSYIHCRRI